ncbi:Eukaryotic translation initiation factor 3 subunit A [Porphyridium purpureum]|uniref:Eukaryotic translation initiation factor 3 subunit A n=1 Tax=Porphyridium purpureum TaxID=35688 RepID=A0A5J4YJU1_PORPP|nr:Eukaryotic translation initiation factor 3 subunit A [Porphyridium purpureum]|eukprot:POR5047..scf246_12
MSRYGGMRSWNWNPRQPPGGIKPENALSRADQLILVGQKERACTILYEIITDNQNRKRTWSKMYEGIMIKLMSLCVELRRAPMVKEALHKYRALCSVAGFVSLDEVVRKLVHEAEVYTEAARKSVEDSFAITSEADVDLEGEIGVETVENLLMEAAGEELSKERVDRQQVVPWMRFMWEVYRVVLDIVKSSAKLETCYHDIAARAFGFCQRYSRFLEFRRLCDMMRQHLGNLLKMPRAKWDVKPTKPSISDVQLTNPETMQRFLDIRFIQLDTAMSLQHWGEAQRTIDDIHMLLTVSKKNPRASTLSKYYEQLKQVFWVSKNLLFHACATSRLYNLQIKQNKNLTMAEARLMASQLLLAVLIIPAFDSQTAVLSEGGEMMLGAGGVLVGMGEENDARLKRTAALLGYNYSSGPVQRSQLVAEITQRDLPSQCFEELTDLFALIEGDELSPTTMAKKLEPILAFIEGNEHLKEYAEGLRRIASFRLLVQLSKVYSVMRLDRLQTIFSFTTMDQVEQITLEALKTRSLSMRIDYQTQCMRFDSAASFADTMRADLGELATRLTRATQLMAKEGAQAPPPPALAMQQENAKAYMMKAVKIARLRAAAEHEAVLQRKAMIEQRKEEQENAILELERETRRKQEQERAAREAEERRRNEEEMRRRDIERRARELEQKEQAELRALKAEIEAKRMAEKSGDKTGENGLPAHQNLPVGADLIIEDSATASGKKGESGELLNREMILTKKREEEIKAKKQLEKKYQQLAKKIDYLRRAESEVSRPYVQEQFEVAKQERMRLATLAHEQILQEAKQRHELDVAEKRRTLRMLDDLKFLEDQLEVQVGAQLEAWVSKETRERQEAIRRAREEKERAEEAERREREEREQREREEAEERERKQREEEEKRQLDEAAAADRRRVQERLESKKQTYVPPASRAAPGVGAAPASSEPYKTPVRASAAESVVGTSSSSGFGFRERERAPATATSAFGSSSFAARDRGEAPRGVGGGFVQGQGAPGSGSAPGSKPSGGWQPPSTAAPAAGSAPSSRPRFINSKLNPKT